MWCMVFGSVLLQVALSQGGRGRLAFGNHNRIPQSFRKARICNFLRKKLHFLQFRKNRQYLVVKRLTYTQTRFLKHPFRCLDMTFYFSMQTCSFELPFRLWKQADFCWKPFKSKLTFVECSSKAGWLSLKAQWEPSKKRVNCDNARFCDKIV